MAFGDAQFSIEGERFTVTSPGQGEAGIEFRPIEGYEGTVFVRFDFSAATPASLRLETSEGFRYSSTETDRHFILGGDFAKAALLYGASPFEMRIELVDTGSCDDPGLVCLRSGALAYTPVKGDAAGKLLFGAMGNSVLEATPKGGLILSSHEVGAEYGAVLTLVPDLSGQRYILEFEVPKNTSALLRSTRNGKQRYFSAQRGWARLWDDAEVVIFDRAAAKFEIRNLKLIPCTEEDWRCKSRADFDSMLPLKTDTRDFDYAVDLLFWATTNSDYALSLQIEKDFLIEGLEAWEIYYKYYRPNVASGYCGGTSEFFAKLLREQGFDAFTWNFGNLSDDLTHVTTVLHFDGRFYLLDATFGAYFVEPETERPLEVSELLSGQAFAIVGEAAETRDFVLMASDLAAIEGRIRRDAIKNCEPLEGSQRMVCKYPSFGLDEYLAMTSPTLVSNGLTSDQTALIEMMKAGTFGIGNMENTDSMKAFARLLVEHGVPMIETEGGLSPKRLLETVGEPLSP